MRSSTEDLEAFEGLIEGKVPSLNPVDQRLGKLIRALERMGPEVAAPRVDFREALRARVVAEAERAARISVPERAAIAFSVRSRKWRQSLRFVAATGLAAAMLLGTGSAFALSRQSLPGDALYPLKKVSEAAHLSVTRAPQQRGYLLLGFARTRLQEIGGLTDKGNTNSSLYVATLKSMDGSTNDATELLIRLSTTTSNETALEELSDFTTAQRRRLEVLLDRIPAAAVPAARGSLQLLAGVSDRVSAILCDCTLPTGGASTSTATPGEPACVCRPAGTRTQPSTDGDNQSLPTDKPTSKPGTKQTPPPTTEPGLIDTGTPLDQPVNDLVDGLVDSLNDLGVPVPTPSPLPSVPLGQLVDQLPVVPGL